MKRYRLKKDLPTFKTGDEFYRGESGHLFAKGANGGQDIIAYRDETLAKFPNILKEWFEEIPEEPKTVWDLEDGDSYFCLCSDGSILECTWSNHHGPCSIGRDCGSVFLTEQDAKKELARRRAEVILRRDAKGFKPRPHYQGTCVYYDHKRNSLDFSDCIYADGTIRFAIHSDVHASIKAHPKEWLIYLGVEDEE